MTMTIEIFTGQQMVHVWITARAEEVMHASAIFVHAVGFERIRRYRRQWPQIWQVRPQSIKGRYVSGLKLTRARCPKSFSRIACTPNVQVSYLRTLDCYNTTDLTRRDVPCPPRADRDLEGLHQCAATFCDSLIKFLLDVECRSFGGLIRRCMIQHLPSLRSWGLNQEICQQAPAAWNPSHTRYDTTVCHYIWSIGNCHASEIRCSTISTDTLLDGSPPCTTGRGEDCSASG